MILFHNTFENPLFIKKKKKSFLGELFFSYSKWGPQLGPKNLDNGLIGIELSTLYWYI
jgi:hypothetical protein